MNNKAYTLIELLGVIVIIGVISVIALPKIFNSKTNSTFYKAQESLALITGQDYFSDNRNALPKNIGEASTVKISTLINEGYMKELLDVKKDNCNYEESYITVTKEKAKYMYDIRLKCNSYDTFANKNK